MIPGAPKFSRVEISFKENASTKILNEVLNSKSETLRVFEDCAVMISGDHLFVIEDNYLETPESVKCTKNHIFQLSQIENYKIFNF